MNEASFNNGQEEIRNALIEEYLLKHPGLRKQDVVFACKDGELIVTEIASLLRDQKLKDQSGSSILQASRMFSESSIHQDERWKDSVHSAQQSFQIIDCLHSSNFDYLNDSERITYQNRIKQLEGISAKLTVQRHELADMIDQKEKETPCAESAELKILYTKYIYLLIDQLNVLHLLYKCEIKLADLFLDRSKHFIPVNVPPPKKFLGPFCFQYAFQRVSDRFDKKEVSHEDTIQLNYQIVRESNKSIESVIDAMKQELENRRQKIQEIWSMISKLQDRMNPDGQSE